MKTIPVRGNASNRGGTVKHSGDGLIDGKDWRANSGTAERVLPPSTFVMLVKLVHFPRPVSTSLN